MKNQTFVLIRNTFAALAITASSAVIPALADNSTPAPLAPAKGVCQTKSACKGAAKACRAKKHAVVKTAPTKAK